MPDSSGLPDEWLHAALAVLLVWIASILLPGSFWIMDEAFNFLQIEAVFHNPVQMPPSIPAPGLDSAGDMAGSLRPLPHHYGFMRDGRLFSQYSPAFAIAVLPFRALLGRIGSSLLPALSLGVLLFVLGRMLHERGFNNLTASAVLVLGTPVLFYSLTLWGHLPALALCAGAWYMHRRGRPFPSAALLLAACLLREECLAFLPFFLLSRKPDRILIRIAIAVIFVFTFLATQKLMTGSWLGTHLQASGAEAGLYGFASVPILERKALVMRSALLSCLPSSGLLPSSIVGALLWLVWAVSRGDSRRSLVLTATGAAVSASAAILAAAGGFQLFSLFELKHPLVVFPALWLAGKPARGWIVPASAFLVTLLAMEPMHSLDVAWGMRLLMPATLMLVIASVRPGRGTAAALLAGFVITSVSIGFLVSKRTRSASLVEAAAREGGAVIATSWELPGEFAALQSDGMPVLFADSTAEFARALEILEPLSPVVVSPVEDVPAALRVASSLDIDLVPVFSVRFDPALEVVMLKSARGEDADP